MSTLCIRSSFSLCLPAVETPQDLKPELTLQTGRPGPRRVNRWIQLALLGARQCVAEQKLPEDTAIYLTTRNGAVGDTLALLTGNAQNLPPAPFRFINVSGNMAAYYLAADLGLHGANQLIVSHQLPFFSLLELARVNGTQSLLLGAVEELVWPLEIHRQRLQLPADARIGESSHWALIELNGSGTTIEHLQRCANDAAAREWLDSQDSALPISVIDARSADALNRPVTTLARAQLANSLVDAELILHWQNSLRGQEILALRDDNGAWGLLQARA